MNHQNTRDRRALPERKSFDVTLLVSPGTGIRLARPAASNLHSGIDAGFLTRMSVRDAVQA